MSTTNLSWKKEKFSYKCDGHSSNISEKLLNLYKKGEFFDTIIYAGNNSIKIQAHSIVLTALSEYFSEIFRYEQTVSKIHIIKLNEIESCSLKLIIDFMYSGCIEFSLESMENIFRTAFVLKLQDLFNACYDFVDKHTTAKDCLNWFRLANKLNLPTLQKNSLAYAYSHFQEVIRQNDVLLLSKAELKDFLFYQNPHEDFEELVLLSLIAWIKYDSANREHLTPELLSMVRYQFLSPEVIMENRNLIRKNLGYEFLCKWLQINLSPKLQYLTDHQNPNEFDVSNLAMIYHENEYTTVIRIYNRANDFWTSKKHIRLPWKKEKLYNTIVIGTKLYVVGGCIDGETTNTVDCLDLGDFKWTAIPAMHRARGNCQLANLNGNLCVFGGFCNGDFVDSVDIYKYSTRQWYNFELIYSPSKDSRILAHNGTFYLVDFVNGFLQCYNFFKNEWTFKVLDKKQLRNFSLVGIGDFVSIIGGKKYVNHVNTVMRFDVVNNKLSDVAPLGKARSSVNAHVFRNKIIILGGFPYWKLIEVYNPDIDTWTNLNPITMNKYYDMILCSLPPWIK